MFVTLMAVLTVEQLGIRDEVEAAKTIDDLVRNHPIYLNVTVHYIRPKQSTFAREAFQTIIKEVVDSSDLDLETDPTLVSYYQPCTWKSCSKLGN